MLPRRTLVAPDYQPYILVEKPSAYTERYDFIGTITRSDAIVCATLTPEDRVIEEMKDFRKKDVNE